MRNKNDERTGASSGQELHGLIDHFFFMESAASRRKKLWSLFTAALSSQEVDSWTCVERGNMATLYAEITELITGLEQHHKSQHEAHKG
jgi:hypothetical protein